MATRAQKRALHQTLGFLIAAFIGVLSIPAMYYGFQKIDCYNATRNLQFMNDCIAADNCTLNQREMHRLQAYTRLQLKSCPRD